MPTKDFKNDACGIIYLRIGRAGHPFFAYYCDKGERVSLGRFKTFKQACEALERFLAKSKRRT